MSGDPLDTLCNAETPEGIALALRPAGLVARCYAYAVDGGIRLLILIAVSAAMAGFGRFGSGIFLVSAFLLEWFYPVLFELLPGAATPGKRVAGLRVVMDTGLPVTPAAALVRNLLRAADFLPVLYAFGGMTMLLRPDFKRLGDLAAGTLVVHDRTEKLDGPLPPADAADVVAPPRQLGIREQAAVIAWAGRAARLTVERHGELALLAAPVAGTATDAVQGSRRLLGVAHWLVGRR